jgi:VanZ family protein
VQINRPALKFWLPLFIWMAVIFIASSDAQSAHHSSILFEPLLHWLFPQMSQTRVEQIHYLFRKSAHLTEYAVLALLFWRAIRQPQKNAARPWNWPEAGLALAMVFLYAASDEFHQIFVATRTAQVSDVFIDTAGGTTGLLLLWLIGKVLKRW